MTEPSIKPRLDRLLEQGWELSDDQKKICRDYSFGTFAAAFALMSQVAKQAEIMNHHPDWSNSYNRLQICLTTHSLGAITLKDIELAEFIERQRQLASASEPGITGRE